MSLIQINENLLLDLVESLKKVALLKGPETEEELELVKAWVTVSSNVKDILEPLGYIPGFDAEAAYWTQLGKSYRQEVRDFESRQSNSQD